MTIKINPDKEHVERVREMLGKSGGHCPCQIPSEETKCICKSFLEQESGWCHCHLYYKEEE